jgi:hypothetical protein
LSREISKKFLPLFGHLLSKKLSPQPFQIFLGNPPGLSNFVGWDLLGPQAPVDGLRIDVEVFG